MRGRAARTGRTSGDHRRGQAERREQSRRMMLAMWRGVPPAAAVVVVATLLGARRGAYYLGLAGYALVVTYLLREDFRSRWIRR